MKFVEKECEEEPEAYTIFSDFYKDFNVYLKKHRLRPMTKHKMSEALKHEGFIVKARRAFKPDSSEEIHTTCIYGLIINKNSKEEQKGL